MLLTADTHRFLTEDVLKLLQRNDIYTVPDFLKQENRLIERYTSLTYPEIIDVKNQLAKKFSAPPIDGLALYQKVLSQSVLVPTGFPSLDDLLKGGLCTGTIYELCGEADSELLHFVLATLRNFVCGGNRAYFLDAKRDFSAKLMKAKLTESKGLDEGLRLLNKILLRHVPNKFELVKALFDIKTQLEESGATTTRPPRIIIIHSIHSLFMGSKDHTLNNNLLNHVANVSRYLAVEHQIVIVTTNLITTWAEAGFQGHGEGKEKIACGKYWAGVPNVRFKVGKQADGKFEIELLKHNNVFSSESCVVNL